LVLAKDENSKDRLETVIYNLLESIRVCGASITPFLPDTGEEILRQLNISDSSTSYKDTNIYTTNSPKPLFQRIDKEEKLKEIESFK